MHTTRRTKEGKPLLVLVGAEWCPGCRTMKNEMIPELQRGGGLKPVVFATVDTDEKPDLSQRLLRGVPYPNSSCTPAPTRAGDAPS